MQNTIPAFQLSGLSAAQFEHLWQGSEEALRMRHAVRCVATAHPGFPCRISLQDAQVGEEVLLLPHAHQAARSPYQASGPIFVRRDAVQARLAPGVVPPYVSNRLISLRAYDAVDQMVDAMVCAGVEVATALEQLFAQERIAYVHLHNAKQGCFSCLATRVEPGMV